MEGHDVHQCLQALLHAVFQICSALCPPVHVTLLHFGHVYNQNFIPENNWQAPL